MSSYRTMRLSHDDLWQIRLAMRDRARSEVEKAATAKAAALYSVGLLPDALRQLNECSAARFMASANQAASLYDRVIHKLRLPKRKAVRHA